MKALLAKIPVIGAKFEVAEAKAPEVPEVPDWPESRRARASKALIVTLILLPPAAAGLYFWTFSDPEGNWEILTRDIQVAQIAIPGTGQEGQPETGTDISVKPSWELAVEGLIADEESEETPEETPEEIEETPEELAARLAQETAEPAVQEVTEIQEEQEEVQEAQEAQPESQEAQETEEIAETDGELSPEQLAALAVSGEEEKTEEKTPEPLKLIPQPGLHEPGSFGSLPAIAEDGRQSWIEYGRPFEPGEFTRFIGLVMVDLGMNAKNTEKAILTLPRNITLAFSPYAQNLDDWVEMARKYGHEVMIGLPMEPIDFPLYDPGPRALMTSLDSAQNLLRAEWILARAKGLVGVVSIMGSKFAASDRHIRPVVQMMKDRGLMYLDAEETQRSLGAQLSANLTVPNAVGNLVVDTEIGRRSIDTALRDLERLALRTDTAIGIARPYPVTIQRINRWVGGLDRREITLAPITHLVNRQTVSKMDASALARQTAACEEGDAECLAAAVEAARTEGTSSNEQQE